jgi:hypothetical protein
VDAPIVEVQRPVRSWRHIQDLKPDELRWVLEHREVMHA